MGKKFTTILMAALTAASGMAMAAIPESSIPTGATSGNARKLPTFYKETRRLNRATEKPAEMIRPGQRVMMPTSPIRKSPLRITDGGTDIYGWAYYGNPTGMYRVVGTRPRHLPPAGDRIRSMGRSDDRSTWRIYRPRGPQL